MKAILVIDEMPKSCEDCKFNTSYYAFDDICSADKTRCPLITEEQYVNRIYPILYDMVVRGILYRNELAKKVSCANVGEEE